jgi:hypothetical protein
VQERARMDPTREEAEQRDLVPGNKPELTTADMANSSRPAEPATPEQPQGRPPQLRAVPAPSDIKSPTEPDVSPLLGTDEASGFRTRWDSIQAQFVDDPRHAVEDADHLVAEAIQRLAGVFADERAELERQWGKGDDVSTEDLRVSLQHYRSFFQRLIAA